MKKILLTLTLILLISQPVYAKTYMFRAKASDIQSWMYAQGVSGSVYDCLMAYFSGLSSLSEGTLYDHVNDVLTAQGYTGTLQDKLDAFFITETGVSNPKDAERAFWANTSNSFGGGFVFYDGNNFMFVDGNNFVFYN